MIKYKDNKTLTYIEFNVQISEDIDNNIYIHPSIVHILQLPKDSDSEVQISDLYDEM